MLKVGSVTNVADNTGAKNALIICILGASMKKTAKIGDIVKIAVQSALPNGMVEDHSKHKAVVVRTAKEYKRSDGSYIRFDDNSVVILDGNTKNPKGTRIFGPIAREVKNLGYDKISSLAQELL